LKDKLCTFISIAPLIFYYYAVKTKIKRDQKANYKTSK